MNVQEAIAFLRTRPAVHQLCSGSWLQAPFRISFDVTAVPLAALGYRAQAQCAAQYVTEIIGALVDQQAFESLIKTGTRALPVIVLCAPVSVEAAAEALENLATPRLDRARQVLAWATGEEITPFAMVVAGLATTQFRMLPPQTRRRQRLFGLGETKDDFEENLSRLMRVAVDDEHFAFALSLHHDALRESNSHFRIGRLFNVLECLAYRLKSEERPSRKAVKYLIGLEDGATSTVHVGDREYRYDCIEIGGRVRDKLFHGVPFRREDLITDARPAFDLYEQQPEIIADALVMFCELELAKWANGTSRGLHT